MRHWLIAGSLALGGALAPGLAPAAMAQAGVRAGNSANPACALLTTAEVRAASGHDYDAGDEGDAPGEGLGGGSSCQWGGAGFGPGKRLPMLGLVLIPRRQQSFTEAGLRRKPREGCTREQVRGLGELAYVEVCARSRGPVVYVKVGAHDLVVQLDAEPPATAASVKPALLAVARAAAAKLRAP